MRKPRLPRVTTRKWGGDDTHSWAVFIEGMRLPVETGLTRTEARYAKQTHERLLAERMS